MRWQEIGVRLKGTNLETPDLVDVLQCQRQKSEKHCQNCPYIQKCNKYERRTNDFIGEFIHPVIPELNKERN